MCAGVFAASEKERGQRATSKRSRLWAATVALRTLAHFDKRLLVAQVVVIL
jgi:hypothetical protein